MTAVLKAVATNAYPQTLDDFWTGKPKYGFSGSMVMFIDRKVGRVKLKELLIFNRQTDLPGALGTTEAELLKE